MPDYVKMGLMAARVILRNGADEGGGAGGGAGGDAGGGAGAGEGGAPSLIGQAGQQAVQPPAGDAKSGEQKPGEAQPGADGNKEPTAEEIEAAANAPFAVDLGENMKVYEAEIGSFTGKANEYLSGLKTPAEKAAAKAAFDFACQYQADAVKDGHKNAAQSLIDQVDGWEKSVKEDKEFGGANFEGTISEVADFLRVFGDPDLTTILDQSGLGSHPSIVKALAKAGRMAKESDILAGGTGSESKVSFANSMFPGNKKG